MSKRRLKKMICSRFIGAGLLIGMLVMFVSCGKRASADKLVSNAKSQHGDVEIISKTEKSDHVEVIVKDKAQGFEYKLSSKMDDINIDGSNFGSVPSSSDTFILELVKYTLSQGQSELDDICKKNGITYESQPIDYDEEGNTRFLTLTIPNSLSEEDGIKIAEKLAEVFQKYNVNERLNGFQIYLEHDAEWFKDNYGTYKMNGNNKYPAETYSSSGMHIACNIGYARLPECKFIKK